MLACGMISLQLTNISYSASISCSNIGSLKCRIFSPQCNLKGSEYVAFCTTHAGITPMPKEEKFGHCHMCYARFTELVNILLAQSMARSVHGLPVHGFPVHGLPSPWAGLGQCNVIVLIQYNGGSGRMPLYAVVLAQYNGGSGPMARYCIGPVQA